MNTNRVSVTQAHGTWVVRAGGAVIGESDAALELVIGDADPIVFFPREDVGMAFLEASETTARSTELGDAEYFGIITRSTTIVDAAWSYPSPDPAAARLAGHLTFDTSRIAVEGI